MTESTHERPISWVTLPPAGGSSDATVTTLVRATKRTQESVWNQRSEVIKPPLVPLPWRVHLSAAFSSRAWRAWPVGLAPRTDSQGRMDHRGRLGAMVDRALTGHPWVKREHDREHPTGARIHRVGITLPPAGGSPDATVTTWCAQPNEPKKAFGINGMASAQSCRGGAGQGLRRVRSAIGHVLCSGGRARAQPAMTPRRAPGQAGARRAATPPGPRAAGSGAAARPRSASPSPGASSPGSPARRAGRAGSRAPSDRSARCARAPRRRSRARCPR